MKISICGTAIQIINSRMGKLFWLNDLMAIMYIVLYRGVSSQLFIPRLLTIKSII